MRMIFQELQPQDKYDGKVDQHGVFVSAIISICRTCDEDQQLYEHWRAVNDPRKAFPPQAVIQKEKGRPNIKCRRFQQKKQGQVKDVFPKHFKAVSGVVQILGQMVVCL